MGDPAPGRSIGGDRWRRDVLTVASRVPMAKAGLHGIMCSMTGDAVELYVTLGHAGDDEFNLRMSPEIVDEVLSSLDEHGIIHGGIIEMSAGQELYIEAVRVLGGAGGLASLASVIKTVVKRNEGKHFLIERDGEKFEANGYSEKAVERILKKRAEEQTARDQEWKRVLGDRDQNDAT